MISSPALTHESEETDWMGHAAGRLKKNFREEGVDRAGRVWENSVGAA